MKEQDFEFLKLVTLLNLKTKEFNMLYKTLKIKLENKEGAQKIDLQKLKNKFEKNNEEIKRISSELKKITKK